MKQARRNFLITSVGGGAALLALGMLRPMGVYAAQFNGSAAGANNLADAYKGLGANQMIESKEILIKAPEIAESGVIVPVEVSSKLVGTSTIAIFVEKNPNPLTAQFEIAAGTEGYVNTRMKMSGSSPVHVVVQAGGKYYHAVKLVKVTEGGCGGPGGGSMIEKDFVVEPVRVRTTMEADLCNVKLVLNHPMESGQRRDARTGQIVPAHYIQNVSATLNGRKVLDAQWSQSIAKNPFLGFKLKGARSGDRVTVAWVDNLGNKNTTDAVIAA